MKIEFESKKSKRTFRQCPSCGAEWPTSTEYCRQCTVWLGASDRTEELTWYMPLILKKSKSFPADGVYEATVVTIAACDSIYKNQSDCPEILLEGAYQIIEAGGILTKSPGGHMVGCFLGKNLNEVAIRCVKCSQAIQIQSEKCGVRTFIGINTGPILIRTPIAQEIGKSKSEITGGVLGCSEALAFSIYPRMIIISPATFGLVSSYFECYGTGPINLWGTYSSTPKTVYVVARAKKVTNWRQQLDDDSFPLVGRSQEIQLLCQYWQETKSGERPTGLKIHLVGEPGSGKTKLLQSFLRKVKKDEGDINLIKLAGANYGRQPGLLLEEFVSECFRQGISSDNLMPKIPREKYGTSKILIPKSPQARFRLICQLLAELESRGPTIIVADDVHWMDKESIKVLGKAFLNLPARMLLIASYRPSGAGLAKLLTSIITRRIILSSLNEDEAKQICKLHLKGDQWISESAWSEIWKKSGGNPLYVEEATKLLLTRRESLPRRVNPDIATDPFTLPSTNAGLLSERIREWADRELEELRRELNLKWGGSSVSSRLASLERQVNDWLDRLETQGYLERKELAQHLEELESFQNKVLEVCLVGGLSRPLTTRLSETISRLYEGGLDEYYEYLLRRSRVKENHAWVTHQALRMAEWAVQKGKLPKAIRFLHIAEETMGSVHPNRRYVLEKAADANFLLGNFDKAIRLYKKVIFETQVNNIHDDVFHKLLAAKLLRESQLGFELSNDPETLCPWHLIITSLAGVLRGENGKALTLADKAEEVSKDSITLRSVFILKALIHLIKGERDKAELFCTKVVEISESGGLSLFSIALHWLLAKLKIGPEARRHESIRKYIAKRLGINRGFKVLQSKISVFMTES